MLCNTSCGNSYKIKELRCLIEKSNKMKQYTNEAETKSAWNVAFLLNYLLWLLFILLFRIYTKVVDKKICRQQNCYFVVGRYADLTTSDMAFVFHKHAIIFIKQQRVSSMVTTTTTTTYQNCISNLLFTFLSIFRWFSKITSEKGNWTTDVIIIIFLFCLKFLRSIKILEPNPFLSQEKGVSILFSLKNLD